MWNSNDVELLLCYCQDAASFTATPIWFKWFQDFNYTENRVIM